MKTTSNLTSLFFRKSFVLLLTKTMGAFAGFGLYVYIARALGPDQLGVYAFALSWVLLLSLLSSFGFEHLNAKSVAAYKIRGFYHKLQSLMLSGLMFVSALGLALSIITLTFVRMLGDTISSDVSNALSVGAVIIPFMAVTKWNSGVLRGLKKQLSDSVLLELLRPLFLLASLYLLLKFNIDSSAPSFVSLTLLSWVFVAGFALYISKTHLPRFDCGKMKLTKKKFKHNCLVTLIWSKKSAPFLLFVALIQLEKNIDTLMLGFFLDMNAVGIYSLAVKISSIILLVSVALNQVASPIFSELYALEQMEKLGKFIKLITIASSFIALFVLGMTLQFGDNVIRIFGSGYDGSALILKIMIIGQCIKALAGPVLMVAVMTGGQKVAVKAIFYGLLLHIVLNLILMPIFGVNGVAISSSISLVCWSAFLSHQLYRRLGINMSLFSKKKSNNITD